MRRLEIPDGVYLVLKNWNREKNPEENLRDIIDTFDLWWVAGDED